MTSGGSAGIRWWCFEIPGPQKAASVGDIHKMQLISFDSFNTDFINHAESWAISAASLYLGAGPAISGGGSGGSGCSGVGVGGAHLATRMAIAACY